MIRYKPKKINIFVAMAKKGFNQTLLSETSGLDRSSISNFLNGKRNPSPTSANKIAEALDTDIEELFEIEVSPEEVNSV